MADCKSPVLPFFYSVGGSTLIRHNVIPPKLTLCAKAQMYWNTGKCTWILKK